MQNITHVISRNTRSENVVAVIRYDIGAIAKRRSLDKPDKFLELLMSIVTEWCTKAKDGMSMLESTRRELNIGDLSVDYQWLHPILLEHGICNFDIQTYVGVSTDWYYDTVLFKG